MDRILPALAGLPPTYLVGGAVRDLLLGTDSLDLDLAVEGDGVAAARELAQRLGGEASEHERFGTATVRRRAWRWTWPRRAASPTRSRARFPRWSRRRSRRTWRGATSR